MNQAKAIHAKLAALTNLPTLPPVIEKLQATVRDPECGPRQVCAIIEDDPAIMARILRVVNSPLFAGLEPVSSLDLAVTRLGFNAIANIALSTAVFSLFARQGRQEFDRVEFWRHSIATGIVVRILYERARPRLGCRHSPDLLHLVGLLHDLGKIVLDRHFSADFMTAVDQARAQQIALETAERAVLGTDHAEVGAWLGTRWNLAPEVLQVIRWHHDPDRADRDGRELVRLVHVADCICNLEHIGDGGNGTSPGFKPGAWTGLGLSTGDLPEVLDELAGRAAESAVLLALVQPDAISRL